MLEPFDKDFKAVIIKMLQGAMMNTFEISEKIKSHSKEIEHFNIKIEKSIKKSQIGLLELKNMLKCFKKIKNRLNSKMSGTDKRIMKLEK